MLLFYYNAKVKRTIQNDWNRNCGTCCVCEAGVWWTKNMQLYTFYFNNASNIVVI